VVCIVQLGRDHPKPEKASMALRADFLHVIVAPAGPLQSFSHPIRIQFPIEKLQPGIRSANDRLLDVVSIHKIQFELRLMKIRNQWPAL
jgi:hypothetical protein